jgi:dolichol kinase
MLPKWHIILGILFSLILLFLFKLSFLSFLLILLASIFIDVDHYLLAVQKTKKLDFFYAYEINKKWSLRKKPTMHIFHTIEFSLLLLIAAFFLPIFYFVLIGILFHNTVDAFDMLYKREFYKREYSLVRYLIKKRDKTYYFN